MTDPAPDPLTAARRVPALGVPEARVKAALQRLGLEPGVARGATATTRARPSRASARP